MFPLDIKTLLELCASLQHSNLDNQYIGVPAKTVDIFASAV